MFMNDAPIRATAEQPPRETQRTITDWAEETFASEAVMSPARLAARANEEMAELITAASRGDASTTIEIGLEAADVVIFLYRLADRLDLDLADLVDEKMKINRLRNWSRKRPDEVGVSRTAPTAPTCMYNGGCRYGGACYARCGDARMETMTRSVSSAPAAAE